MSGVQPDEYGCSNPVTRDTSSRDCYTLRLQAIKTSASGGRWREA